MNDARPALTTAWITSALAATISSVRVEWPGGRPEEWTDVPVDRYTTLKEGEGR